jgi:hypothetical protein
MRLRSHRRNLIVWTSAAVPVGRNGTPKFRRPARSRRIHRWVRTGALFAIIGLMRLPHVARIRWRPMLLLAAGAFTVAGFMLSSGLILIPGILVLLLSLRIPPDSSTASIDPALMPFLVDARADRPPPWVAGSRRAGRP